MILSEMPRKDQRACWPTPSPRLILPRLRDSSNGPTAPWTTCTIPDIRDLKHTCPSPSFWTSDQCGPIPASFSTIWMAISASPFSFQLQIMHSASIQQKTPELVSLLHQGSIVHSFYLRMTQKSLSQNRCQRIFCPPTGQNIRQIFCPPKNILPPSYQIM
jgi:hypothetical protein